MTQRFVLFVVCFCGVYVYLGKVALLLLIPWRCYTYFVSTKSALGMLVPFNLGLMMLLPHRVVVYTMKIYVSGIWNHTEYFTEILEIPRKFLRKNSQKFWMVFNTNTALQIENLFFYACKTKENQRKLRGNFRGNFTNSENSRKISPENSRKIPGKFPENCGDFCGEIYCYSAKIYLFMFIKVRKFGENFPGNFRKISEIPKIPGRIFSGKFPGNSGDFFQWNAMIQRVNLSF